MSRALAIVTGTATVLCSLFGLFYNGQSLLVSLRGGFADLVRQHRMTYFYAAFYAMSVVCIACYLILIWGGFQIARQRFSGSAFLIGVWLFEIVYFLAVSVMWFVPDFGASIAGATGVANGGMMAQFVILLPIWGPIAVVWAKRRHLATNTI